MFPAASYDPDTLNLLNRAFDDAWKELQKYVGVKPVAAEVLRLRLAGRIMAAAAGGERDPSRLKLIGLGVIEAKAKQTPLSA
jgi:hypothetical protein